MDAPQRAALRLWEVTRWGNDEDPATGLDTNYLVVAPDHETAARLVEQRGDRAESLLELGACAPVSASAEACVVRGPYLEHKLNPAFFTEWSRDDELQTWVPTPRCRDGVARCAYADGALAAELPYADGQLHGQAARWHPDGAPLSLERYEHGHPTGTCEWWYPDGRPARRYAYRRVARNQVELTYTRWNREGGIMAHGTEIHRLRRGPRS